MFQQSGSCKQCTGHFLFLWVLALSGRTCIHWFIQAVDYFQLMLTFDHPIKNKYRKDSFTNGRNWSTDVKEYEPGLSHTDQHEARWNHPGRKWFSCFQEAHSSGQPSSPASSPKHSEESLMSCNSAWALLWSQNRPKENLGPLRPVPFCRNRIYRLAKSAAGRAGTSQGSIRYRQIGQSEPEMYKWANQDQDRICEMRHNCSIMNLNFHRNIFKK